MEIKKEYKKYFWSFVITLAVFLSAWYINNIFTSNKISQLQDMYEKISIDILSIETQFDLLKELSCADISEKSVLSNELVQLGRKLSFMEQNVGPTDETVIKLKKFYSLLQIKDMLLMKEVSQKCDIEPVFMIYFYSNQNCNKCRTQGYILESISRKHPKVRIYSFDYDLDLPVIKTLAQIYNVSPKLPALVVQGKTLQGFASEEQITSLIPENALETATSTATSTEQEKE